MISWAIWLPLYGHIFGGNNLATLPLNHGLGGLGPLIASFLTTWIFLKKKGVKNLLARCFQIKPLIYLLAALLSPFILLMLAIFISLVVDKKPVDLSALFKTKEFPGFNFFTFFIYNLLFFGFGEEAGWRGFVLPRLQIKFKALTASVVLTAFWALWHLPLFFYRPGYTNMEIPGIAGWIFSLLTGSILLTWLYNSSRASVLICAVFHSTIDIAFTANTADKNVVQYMGILITVCGILVICIFKPKNLSINAKAIRLT